jgi:hypothetical protein
MLYSVIICANCLSKQPHLRRFKINVDLYILTNQLHGDEGFLRSCQLCSYSRIYQHFMEPEGVHKSPPLVPILSWINPVHTTPFYLRSILILSTHLQLGLSSGLFPSGLPTKILYAFFFRGPL